MLSKVKEYIIDNNLIEEKDKVLVALSGGPDSVCLLHILHTLSEEMKFTVGAIHINHMLRGEESDKDEKYISDLCKQMNIEYHIDRININAIAVEKNISLEMAGREARYAAFETEKKKNQYTKIAVAHNENDQAETILMRMMRGAGLEGLTGIKAKREGNIIRPILCLNRKSIEDYCDKNNLNPRIDKSNFERVYSRNKVRLDILPYMKENFNEDIIETLNRMAILLQKDNEYIEEQAKGAFKRYCIRENGTIRVRAEFFNEEKEAIITRVIKNAFKKISRSHQNFEMKHIYEIIELAKKSTGKKINLTNGIIAENLYGDIILKKEIEKSSFQKEELEIDKDSLNDVISYDKYNIKFEVETVKNKTNFPNNYLIKYFDYDNIKERIIIRNRKDGDRIKPLGVSGSKKIKDLFIDLKIPREERDTIPLVCFDEEVAWVVGYKVSNSFKVTKDTKKILKITFSKRG